MHSGSASVILKNNRNLLRSRKKERFVHIPGAYGIKVKEDYDHVILKPEIITDIRTRLKKENRRVLRIRILIFILMLALLLGLLLL